MACAGQEPAAAHPSSFSEGAPLLLQLFGLGDQEVLLGANDAPGAADADVAHGLLRREPVVLYHVRADQHPRAAQPRLAVHRQRACTSKYLRSREDLSSVHASCVLLSLKESAIVTRSPCRN